VTLISNTNSMSLLVYCVPGRYCSCGIPARPPRASFFSAAFVGGVRGSFFFGGSLVPGGFCFLVAMLVFSLWHFRYQHFRWHFVVGTSLLALCCWHIRCWHFCIGTFVISTSVGTLLLAHSLLAHSISALALALCRWHFVVGLLALPLLALSLSALPLALCCWHFRCWHFCCWHFRYQHFLTFSLLFHLPFRNRQTLMCCQSHAYDAEMQIHFPDHHAWRFLLALRIFAL
jgi:hypothetical protein